MLTIQPDEELVRKLISEVFQELHLMGDEEVHYTTREVAAILRCSIHWVYKLTAAKKIPFYKVSGRILFKKLEVFEYIAKNRKGGTTE